MAKKKYKQKPLSWYCIQYTGTNVAEMTAFCYLCIYDTTLDPPQLLFNLAPVQPTDWILEDQAGQFSMMTNSAFTAFFQLE